MPRVLRAGVPMRRPLATVAGWGSLGMVLRLTMTPTALRACSASRPVRPAVRRSTRKRWLSVPPVTMRRPAPVSVAARAWALSTMRWA